MPQCPAITQPRPMRTLWAIWTRLSILVPSPMTVSAMAPRSTVVLAPISTLSWMMTRPICGIRSGPRRPADEAETVLPDPGAAVDDDAIADQRALDAAFGPI